MDTIHPNSSGDISTGGWKKGRESNFPRKESIYGNVRFVVLCPISAARYHYIPLGGLQMIFVSDCIIQQAAPRRACVVYKQLICLYKYR